MPPGLTIRFLSNVLSSKINGLTEYPAKSDCEHELGQMKVEMVVPYEASWHLPGRTGENHIKILLKVRT
jgi:hypothetical protein